MGFFSDAAPSKAARVRSFLDVYQAEAFFAASAWINPSSLT